MRLARWTLLLFALSATPVSMAHADIALGLPGPAFSKLALGGGTVSLADYSDQVVVLFLLGYDCPYCLSNAPSVEQDIRGYYAQLAPMQVQVLGADLWNGTAGQLSIFQQQTGVAFPLLLNGALASGGNISTLYGPYDNFLVLNKRGIVRYHAALKWTHGNRYHLDEIRACVDSLVSMTASVEGAGLHEFAISASPNPVRGLLHVSLRLAADQRRVRVGVFDLNGRRIASLWDAPAGAGLHLIDWDTHDPSGARVAPGVYMVAAEAGTVHLTRRVVVVQ